MDHKTCTKCNKTLPASLEFFYKNAGGKFGLTPRCKPCVNVDNAESNAKRLKANPEKVRQQNNAKAKKHYYKDVEKSRTKQAEFQRERLSNPVIRKEVQARKRAGGAGLSSDQIEVIRIAQNNCCAICNDSDPTDLDHCHKSKNIRWLLCRHCNRGLGAFRDQPALMRKAADMLDSLMNQEDQPVGPRQA